MKRGAHHQAELLKLRANLMVSGTAVETYDVS